MHRWLWLSWALLTALSAGLCSVGAFLPYWLRGYVLLDRNFLEQLKNDPGELDENVMKKSHRYFQRLDGRDADAWQQQSDIGLFRRCYYPVYDESGNVYFMDRCGSYDTFADIPTLVWKIALILLATTCCILIFLTCMLLFLGCCLDVLLASKKICRTLQLLQLVAGVFTIACCIFYTMGWSGNLEVEQICGPVDSVFSPGRCQLGWAFVLTAAGGFLSLLCTTLPLLITMPHNNSVQTPLLSKAGIVPSADTMSLVATDGISLIPSTSNNIGHSLLVPQHVLQRYSRVSNNGQSFQQSYRHSFVVSPCQYPTSSSTFYYQQNPTNSTFSTPEQQVQRRNRHLRQPLSSSLLPKHTSFANRFSDSVTPCERPLLESQELAQNNLAFSSNKSSVQQSECCDLKSCDLPESGSTECNNIMDNTVEL